MFMQNIEFTPSKLIKVVSLSLCLCVLFQESTHHRNRTCLLRHQPLDATSRVSAKRSARFGEQPQLSVLRGDHVMFWFYEWKIRTGLIVAVYLCCRCFNSLFVLLSSLAKPLTPHVAHVRTLVLLMLTPNAALPEHRSGDVTSSRGHARVRL